MILWWRARRARNRVLWWAGLAKDLDARGLTDTADLAWDVTTRWVRELARLYGHPGA